MNNSGLYGGIQEEVQLEILEKVRVFAQHPQSWLRDRHVAIKDVNPGVRRPKFESDFHYLLASLDQLLICLVPRNTDSQIVNNNNNFTLR